MSNNGSPHHAQRTVAVGYATQSTPQALTSCFQCRATLCYHPGPPTILCYKCRCIVPVPVPPVNRLMPPAAAAPPVPPSMPPPAIRPPVSSGTGTQVQIPTFEVSVASEAHHRQSTASSSTGPGSSRTNTLCKTPCSFCETLLTHPPGAISVKCHLCEVVTSLNQQRSASVPTSSHLDPMCSNLIDLEPEASPSRTTSAGANISASLASPSQDLPENTVPRATGSSALSSRVTNDDERFSAPAVKKDETDEDKAELIARRREILARRAKNIDKINKKLVEKVPLASSTSGQGPSDNSGAGVNRATPQAAADLALPSETSEDFKAAFLAGLAGVAIRDLEIPWEDLEQGSRIGMGSFGEVRRGQWNGTEVAIKIYHEQNLSADLIKEFKAEVAMMARLVHPNIVMFLGAVIEPGKLAIVTEFVSCGSLFSLLHGQTSTDVKRRNALDSKRRLMLATDISRGMQYLHGMNIVHRDLKSPNLLVENNWRAKVCDFGMSRVMLGDCLSTKGDAGTPQYMAPEVLAGEQVDKSSDVYSFGVILYEIFVGERPWKDLKGEQIIFQILSGKRLKLPEGSEHPKIMALAKACLADNPKERPTFTEITERLLALRYEADGPAEAKGG